MSFSLSQLGDLTAFSDDEDFEISGNKLKNLSLDNSNSHKKAKKKKKKKSKLKLKNSEKKERDSDAINTDESLMIRAQSIQDKINKASDSDSLFSLDMIGNGENQKDFVESDDSSIPPGQPEPRLKTDERVSSRKHLVDDALLESDSSLIPPSQKIKIKKIRQANGKRKAECDISSELPLTLHDEEATPNKKRKRDSGRKTTNRIHNQSGNKSSPLNSDVAEDVNSFLLSHKPSSSTKKTKTKARKRTHNISSHSEGDAAEDSEGFHLSHQSPSSTKKTKAKAREKTHKISSQSDSAMEEDVDNFFLSGQISNGKRKAKEAAKKAIDQISNESDSDPLEDVGNLFLSHHPSTSTGKPKGKSASTVTLASPNPDVTPATRTECLESDRSKDDDSQASTSKQMRYKAGPEMKEVIFDNDEFYLEDLGPDDQLWLLRVPSSYPVKNLGGKAVTIGGRCKMKQRASKSATQFCWEIQADVNKNLQKSSMTCLLPSKTDKKLHVAGPLHGEISVIKSYAMKPYAVPPVVKKLVPIPEGLKLRNIAFGADNPSTSRKSSVIREQAASSFDYDEQKSKKKKKKKKTQHASRVFHFCIKR